MGEVVLDITTSVDGFVAGPNASLQDPLGEGGMQLHEWVFGLQSWRGRHGLEGGETGTDDDVVRDGIARAGATIMGRKMFSGGSGPWEDDPNADGWWGDEPPFHTPVFVLTHHARPSLEMEGGTVFHFVTGGIREALDKAREAAGDEDVRIGGGAATIRQYLEAGLIDVLHLAVAPVLLGAGESPIHGLNLPALGYEVADRKFGENAMHVFLRRRDAP
jgi:dihydrofolate reductase